MIFITLTELSGYVQLSPRTITRKISELKEAGQFKKEYPGTLYTTHEAQEIVNLLGLRINLVEIKASQNKTIKAK